MSDDLGRNGRVDDDGGGHEPGLARERTQLAWSRTISFAAVGVAILRTERATGVVVIAMSAALSGLGRLPADERAEAGRGHRLTRRRTMLLIAVTTTLVSLAALALALLS